MFTTNETSHNGVPAQVKHEPQLLHVHPVHVKTQTLNIAKTQHANSATGKLDPHVTNMSNYTNQRILEMK